MMTHGTVCQLNYHGGGQLMYKGFDGKSFISFVRAPNAPSLSAGQMVAC